MKKAIHSAGPDRRSWVPAKSGRAFTLIELLVVLAMLGLLAATFLPAMAGTKRNSKRAQCLANLRQIGVGCSVYANDFNGWYPVWDLKDYSHPINVINGIHYTRYFYTTDGVTDGAVMPRGYALGTGVPYNGIDQNLGYLYGGGMISDGHTFFCPAFSDVSSNSPLYTLNSEYYSQPQFMSTHNMGFIRSSYMFNPRMKTATAGSLRAYQKATDVKRPDVFTIDYLASNIPFVGAPFTPDYWAHWPGKGLQALFTDGSARFCTLAPADFNNVVRALNGDQSLGAWAAQYNVIFNWLRDAP
jgi:prepilin-type N-terminal cleavage/methylation domain-containing protein